MHPSPVLDICLDHLCSHRPEMRFAIVDNHLDYTMPGLSVWAPVEWFKDSDRCQLNGGSENDKLMDKIKEVNSI